MLGRTMARAVGTIPRFRCDGIFPRCEEALARLDSGQLPLPNIVLLDVGLPGRSGLDGISLLKKRAPDAQIVIFTVFDDDEKIYRAICAGASGYLLKGAPMAELIAALEQVARGGSPRSPRVANRPGPRRPRVETGSAAPTHHASNSRRQMKGTGRSFMTKSWRGRGVRLVRRAKKGRVVDGCQGRELRHPGKAAGISPPREYRLERSAALAGRRNERGVVGPRRGRIGTSKASRTKL